jgi:ankyrin repeat protein
VLDRDPNVNLRDRYGWTALMHASRWNKPACVEVILKSDPLLDIRDRQLGRSALIWAAYKSHYDVVILLLEAGADPLVKDINGNRAVDLAGSVQIIAVLNDAMAARADPEAENSSDDDDSSMDSDDN